MISILMQLFLSQLIEFIEDTVKCLDSSQDIFCGNGLHSCGASQYSIKKPNNIEVWLYFLINNLVTI